MVRPQEDFVTSVTKQRLAGRNNKVLVGWHVTSPSNNLFKKLPNQTTVVYTTATSFLRRHSFGSFDGLEFTLQELVFGF